MKNKTAYYVICYKGNKREHSQYLQPSEFHLIKTMFKFDEYDKIEVLKCFLTKEEYKNIFG